MTCAQSIDRLTAACLGVMSSIVGPVSFVHVLVWKLGHKKDIYDIGFIAFHYEIRCSSWKSLVVD